MATAEDKIDMLVTEVKALQASQLKLTTTVEAINSWSVNAEQFSVELSKEMQNLTARMKALELSTTTSPMPARQREEDDQANGRRLPTNF